MQDISRRLQATEKRPQQMMAFLMKLVEDPTVFSGMAAEKDPTKRLAVEKKKRRLAIPSREEDVVRVVPSSGAAEDDLVSVVPVVNIGMVEPSADEHFPLASAADVSVHNGDGIGFGYGNSDIGLPIGSATSEYNCNNAQMMDIRFFPEWGGVDQAVPLPYSFFEG